MYFKSTNNRYNSIRNLIYSNNGAVATSTPIAAQVGLEILKKLNLILIKKMLKIIIKS